MPSVRIFCVDPKLAARLWHLAKPLLAPAFDDGCDDTIESLQDDVATGHALLWLAWDERLVAAATTTIVRTPRHRLCVVSCAGGVHAKLWGRFMPMVESYARAEGCDLVRAMGRKGWARVLDGYEQPWIVLDKRIG